MKTRNLTQEAITLTENYILGIYPHLQNKFYRQQMNPIEKHLLVMQMIQLQIQFEEQLIDQIHNQ